MLTFAFLGAFAVILALNAVVHKYTHIGVARVLGIGAEGPHWGDLHSLAPSVTFHGEHDPWRITVAHYAGGLMIGVAQLGIYLWAFLKRRLSERSALWWLIGLAVATIATGVTGQGLIEGAFHDAYVGQSLASIAGQLAFIVLGTGLHMVATRRWLMAQLRIPEARE